MTAVVTLIIGKRVFLKYVGVRRKLSKTFIIGKLIQGHQGFGYKGMTFGTS